MPSPRPPLLPRPLPLGCQMNAQGVAIPPRPPLIHPAKTWKGKAGWRLSSCVRHIFVPWTNSLIWMPRENSCVSLIFLWVVLPHRHPTPSSSFPIRMPDECSRGRCTYLTPSHTHTPANIVINLHTNARIFIYHILSSIATVKDRQCLYQKCNYTNTNADNWI